MWDKARHHTLDTLDSLPRFLPPASGSLQQTLHLWLGAEAPPKPMMHIPPIFPKKFNFPLSLPNLYISATISSKFKFFCLIYAALIPYFDHDAFMHTGRLWVGAGFPEFAGMSIGKCLAVRRPWVTSIMWWPALGLILFWTIFPEVASSQELHMIQLWSIIILLLLNITIQKCFNFLFW